MNRFGIDDLGVGIGLRPVHFGPILAGESFGTVLFDFAGSEGGWVSARYSAFGRFSLELNAACLDE